VVTLAAEQGVTEAQGNLGIMYSGGYGVQQDIVVALMWFEIAAANENVRELKNRDMLAEEMTPSQIEKAQKLAREWVKKHSK